MSRILRACARRISPDQSPTLTALADYCRELRLRAQTIFAHPIACARLRCSKRYGDGARAQSTFDEFLQSRFFHIGDIAQNFVSHGNALVFARLF
jgi:hypothetical protein